MIKTYYINLDHRLDRKHSIEQRLNALNLSSERIPAITPSELSQEQKAACQRSYRTSDPIIEVEMCCNLSHRRSYEKFLATEDEFALIIEDDALIADDLPTLLADIEEQGMPCDLLKLETFIDRTQFGVKSIAKFGRYSARTMHSYTWGTAGYVINRKAAQHYLNAPKFLTVTTDRTLWRRLPNASGLKVLQLYPAPIVQIDRLTGQWDAHSSIAAARSEIHSSIVKNEPLLAKLRRFYRDEFTIAVPALLHRALKRSDRGTIPFTGQLPQDALPKEAAR